jgi:translation initiation factor IF-2
VVLDCYNDKGLGLVMTVLVRWGSLRPGACVVAGQHYGRIKKIIDQRNKTLQVGGW